MAIVIADLIHWGEVEGGQMVRVIGGGEAVDMGVPSTRGHRHAQVVQSSPATNEGFSTRLVVIQDSCGIE